MKLCRIFNNKSTAIVGILFAVGYLLPDAETMTWHFKETTFGLIWLLGAIFVWKRQRWATVVLLLLALYEFIFEVIHDISNFGTIIEECSATFELAKSTVQTLGIVLMFLVILMLFFVVAHFPLQ